MEVGLFSTVILLREDTWSVRSAPHTRQRPKVFNALTLLTALQLLKLTKLTSLVVLMETPPRKI